jgi:hypothetical protein
VGYGSPQPTTNGFAVASLVLGIVGLALCLVVVGPILALVFGYKARREIDESNGLQTGRGLATAGIVLGWIGVGLAALWIVLIAIGAAFGDGSS